MFPSRLRRRLKVSALQLPKSCLSIERHLIGIFRNVAACDEQGAGARLPGSIEDHDGIECGADALSAIDSIHSVNSPHLACVVNYKETGIWVRVHDVMEATQDSAVVCVTALLRSMRICGQGAS